MRFFTPLRWMASIRFSGLPHSPKPPLMITAPSWMSRTASSALATTLFIGLALHHQGDALAAADAQGGHAAPLVEVLQLVQQRHQHPRARGADGVAQPHRPA